jgi:hypothetical protein
MTTAKRTVTFTIEASDSTDDQIRLLLQAIGHVQNLIYERYVADLGLKLVEFEVSDPETNDKLKSA